MTSLRRKFLLAVVNVIAVLGAAFGLLALIERLPVSMPYPVYKFLRILVTAIGHEELDNPDDMFGLAFVLYLSISLIIAAVIVTICNVAIRGYLAKRRGRS